MADASSISKRRGITAGAMDVTTTTTTGMIIAEEEEMMHIIIVPLAVEVHATSMQMPGGVSIMVYLGLGRIAGEIPLPMLNMTVITSG
jgi:hypothetical protein